jgi:hypothetical protein
MRYPLKMYTLYILILSVLFFSGCNFSSGDSSDDDSDSDSDSASWSYTSSSPLYEVGSGVTSLTVSGSGLSGKTLYLAKVNPTSTAISSGSTRYVVSSSGLSSDISSSSSVLSASVSGSSVNLSESSLLTGSGTGPDIRNFVPPQTFRGKKDTTLTAAASTRSASASISASASVTQITPTVDTTTKDIYIDQDSDISTFSSEKATLRAIGTYCYVWVVDDYYTSGTASGNKVDSTVASDFATIFDNLYAKERNVFGDESDEIYYSYSSGTWSTAAMSTLSDTGTKVNIVIYDIGGGDSSNGSVVGYFYAKDYYPDATDVASINGVSYNSSDVRQYSNEGKYFYVDSYYAASTTYRSMTYSTLAHEFQHMIDWNVKDMTQNLSPSTWYNEMLSMLCEDMMQDYIGVSDTYSPKGRLPTFNEYYRYVGLEYNSTNSSYVTVSYATAYAFGAWCARQFGGAAFVQAMSQNSKVDTASVVAAVNSINGTSYTMADLLKMYAEACVFNSSTLKASYTYPTFNQAAAQTLTYDSYSYPMAAINLWSTANDWTSGSTTYYGPALYGCTSSYLYDLRPYGFTLHTIGTASSSSVTLKFSSSGSSNEDLYVMVQTADDYSTE